MLEIWGQGALGALAQDHEGQLRTIRSRMCAHVGQGGVARDHVVTEAGHDRCHLLHPFIAPIGDENAQP